MKKLDFILRAKRDAALSFARGEFEVLLLSFQYYGLFFVNNIPKWCQQGSDKSLIYRFVMIFDLMICHVISCVISHLIKSGTNQFSCCVHTWRQSLNRSLSKANHQTNQSARKGNQIVDRNHNLCKSVFK